MNKISIFIITASLILLAACSAPEKPEQAMDAQQASETAEPTGASDSAEAEDSSEAVKEPADEPSNEIADESDDVSDDVSAEVPDITAGIDEITKFGNIVLTIGPDSMSSPGYEPADIVLVRIGDDEEEMKNYADYNLTNYSKCDIIAADMSTDFFSADFRQKLAECYRFMISHEGPYLIHCNEGKDRTGFVVAVLESFMGADENEIVEDYMLTYYNFYGIEPGSKQYDQISAGSIEGYLEKAFKIPSIRKDDVDLQACAETYLLGLGLSEEELAALRDKLSLDYGGLGTQ